MNGTTSSTSANTADITLESVQAAIDAVLEGPFLDFAAKYGFDLLKGDMLIMPEGSLTMRVPKRLQAVVRESTLVKQPVLLKDPFEALRNSLRR